VPTALLTALLTALALATAAGANVGETIVRRCTHGESLSGFSQQAYNQALKDLSAGTEEYSNCAQLIRQAQLAAAAAAGHGGEATSSGPTTAIAPTAAEQQAIAQAPSAGATAVRLGAGTIHPGVVPVNIASAFSALPTPLLATVVFLVVCLLVAAGAAIRNKIRGRGAP
jgi:hypothetical protein